MFSFLLIFEQVSPKKIFLYNYLGNLNIWTYCLLAPKVSEEKYADNNKIIEDLLSMMSSFSLDTFKLPALSLPYSDCNFSWGECFWAYVPLSWWDSWVCRFISHIKFWEFLAIIPCNNLSASVSASSSRPPTIPVLVHLKEPHKTLRLYSLT